MPCPIKTTPRWTRRKDARPQEVQAAALDLFVERGYAATRLEDVAARAGVSKGTLYLYFANKEELFKAVVRENVLPAIGEAEQVAGRHDGSSADLLLEIMKSWWERVGSTKLSGIMKLMMAESCNFPELAAFYYEEVISRANSMITGILERGIARGEFRRIDTAHAMHVIVSPMLMLMMWRHSFGICHRETIDPQEYLKCYADLLLHGLIRENSPQPD